MKKDGFKEEYFNSLEAIKKRWNKHYELWRQMAGCKESRHEYNWKGKWEIPRFQMEDENAQGWALTNKNDYVDSKNQECSLLGGNASYKT